MIPHYVVFGKHVRLPVGWATSLSPTAETHTLQGWVKQHQKALSHVYQTAKRQSQHQQERDQTRHNRQAKLAPLFPGERVLICNFRRRARGKLTPRWSPEPFVVIKQLREDHPVYVLRPEGKEAPTRTVHRNNLRPCPLNVLQDSREPAEELKLPTADQPNQLPPPTWWLPGLIMSSTQQPAAQTRDPAPAQQPDPPEEPAAPNEEPDHPNILYIALSDLILGCLWPGMGRARNSKEDTESDTRGTGRRQRTRTRRELHSESCTAEQRLPDGGSARTEGRAAGTRDEARDEARDWRVDARRQTLAAVRGRQSSAAMWRRRQETETNGGQTTLQGLPLAIPPQRKD
ncbi:hypothetical protein ABVT39_024428 [Epinephelus coioides]